MEQPKGKAVDPVRLDRFGDPLPPAARARLGSVRFRHRGRIGQVAFAPDSKSVAATDAYDTVCLWDVATGRELRRLENATSGRLPGVAFSPDGKILATAQEHEILRWDLRTWMRLPSFPVKSCRPGKLFFSPDGKVLACLGMAEREARDTFVFLDASTGLELHRLHGLKMRVAPLIAFAPDSKTWAYVDRNEKTIGIYDVRTGKELRRFKGHANAAETVAFSPDGGTLASTDEVGTLRFWEVKTGKLLPRKGRFSGYYNLVYTPDGRKLASLQFGVPVLYDLTSEKVLRAPERLPWGDGDVVLAPNGKVLAWASSDILHLCDAGTLKRLRPATHEEEVRAAVFAPDSAVVVSAAGEYGFVRRWETNTGKALTPFGDLRDRIYALAAAPDGRVLAVGTDVTLWLLDAATGKPIRKLPHVAGERIASLAFSSDGRTLAVGQEKDIQLWDVGTGKLLRTIAGDTSSWQQLCVLAPDGRTLAVANGQDGVMHLIEVATGKKLRTIQGVSRTVHSIAFAPDGKAVAAGESDGIVTLWDAATGGLLWRAKGHTSWVRFVAFSPDGKMVASGSGDRSVRLWEVTTGKERWHFAGHRQPVRTGVFSPDGKLLVTGSADTTLLVWDLNAPVGKPLSTPPSASELNAYWADLAGADARKAFRATRLLAAAPAQALPLLRDRLKPVSTVEPNRLRKLLEALDSDTFARRKAAAGELEKLADPAALSLRRTERETASAEVRRTLRGILKRLDDAGSPERLRTERAVEVVEWLGTPEAVKLLDEWATGAAGARLTREAAAARERLRKISMK